MLRSKTLIFIGAVMMSLPAAALQVSPTYQLFQLKGGDSVAGQMAVTNNEAEPVTIKPSVKDWYLLNVNSAYKADTWLHLDDQSEFTLKPGESHLLTYKIAPHKKAKGELAGAITLSNKPKPSMITLQLSVVQYAGIKGTEKLAMDIAGLGINISSNTEVGVMMTNTGNVHIRPRGFIYVDTPNGTRVLNVEIPIGQPVFPGQSKLYSGTVKGFTLQPGTYNARIELSDVDRPIQLPVKNKKFTVGADGKVEVH